MSRPVVTVNFKAVHRLESGHPWIFSSDVISRGAAAPGDVVTVKDPKGGLRGTAHYSSSSKITLRLLSADQTGVDAAFFRSRIEAALAHRRHVVDNSEAYRLVHAEGDLLPGLIVDRYGPVCVLQLLTQGMDRCMGDILAALEDLCSPTAVVARNDAPTRRLENLEQEKKVAAGELPEDLVIRMNALRWKVSPLEGQKTGVFLDQRENYAAAAHYAKGQALDCYTCTGGFALHLASKCTAVEAVDSSARALETAARNAALNGVSNVRLLEADVFEVLAAHGNARRRFDTIILDPPAFAKSRADVENALRAYREINLRGLRLLGRGGVLVSCSCSHHIQESDLLETIAQASLDAGRRLRVLERRTQARDHPILLTVPETHYLKCLILEVLDHPG